MSNGSMERWAGILKVTLNPNNGGPFFKIAASLLQSPSSKTLAIPSLNAIFFKGDRVAGTGNPAIERLSDSKNIAEILVSKLGPSVNVWVVEASTFYGPFAVFKEFVPTVDLRGDPKHYDAAGFPASSSIVAILSKSIEQAKSVISCEKNGPLISGRPAPRTAIFGFSKGGIVINQIFTELANLNPIGQDKTVPQTLETKDIICPATTHNFLRSLCELHYVDVGLNCHGAYLTDQTVIDKVAQKLTVGDSSVRFVFHGTPRQWCDHSRPWIRREKDSLLQLLRDLSKKYGCKLQVLERFYFGDMQPTLQMHFEIIHSMDVS